MKQLIEVPEYIVCSAIYVENFEDLIDNDKHFNIKTLRPANRDKGIMITGLRHGHCIYLAYAIASAVKPDFSVDDATAMFYGFAEQGFITSHNRYLNREEAAVFIGNTPRTGEPTNCLYSEDLY
jgi:hypothetical protein